MSITDILRFTVCSSYVVMPQYNQPILLRKRIYEFLSTGTSFFFGLPVSILLISTHSVVSTLLSFPLLFMAVLFIFHLIENSFVYARNEPLSSRLLCDSPEKYGFHSWEFVELQPEGKRGPRVTAYLLLSNDPIIRSSCPTIFILHGNAGNMGHRLPLCLLLFEAIQCNIFIVDYRGYGYSTGIPTESGLYADARCGLEFLLSRPDIASGKIFVLGRSIGGAVAINMATNPALNGSLCGVIVENTFTSLPAAGQHIFQLSLGNVVKYLMPQWMFLNSYPSLQRIQSVAATCRETPMPKLLFISGDADDLIPPKMMQELANAYCQNYSSGVNGVSMNPKPVNPSVFCEQKNNCLVSFPGGKHNNTWLCDKWIDVIHHFIQRNCSSSGHTKLDHFS